MDFKGFIERCRSNKGFENAENIVLNIIKNINYPVNHPFLEYPNTAEGMGLFFIIFLKLLGIDETVIEDLIKKCKSIENNQYNYTRFRQNFNEVLFLYYVCFGLFTRERTIPKVLYQDENIIDNNKIPEYSILFNYNNVPYLINVEVKTLSCDAMPNTPVNDGDKYIMPYYKDENFIADLEKQFPDAKILTNKCCLFQLERNICKIAKKFEGNNLSKYTLFNIGVIFIDLSTSIEQFYSYFFNEKFGVARKTNFGNIDALVIMTLDAKVDLFMSNIYNSGYVQTLLFKDSKDFIEICKEIRLDNFMNIGDKVREDVLITSKREYETLKVLKRDGFLNFIPFDASEKEIQEYLNFLKGDIPRNTF